MEAVSAFKGSGLSNVVFHQLDVRDESSVDSLAKFVKTQFGRLDILLSGQATNKVQGVMQQTYEKAEECLDTNYYGVKRVTQALLPLLKLSPSGARIVNVSSLQSELKLFDGHGGSDAAAYMRKNAMKFFFEDADFPQGFEVNNVMLEEVENSIRNTFLLADIALGNECTVSSSSGTTALTALILGRLLLVANAGDCRAVLCRKVKAIEMSQDHRPIHTLERTRVEKCGGYIDDGYLNGVLSVSRAFGDWDMKLPQGSPSPLIVEPEFRQAVLTEDDEFLIMGCDGIWDVM